MKIADVLQLPKGVKEISSVEGTVAYVGDVKPLNGIAKTGKNKGKPYAFFVQDVLIRDGESQIYANLSFKNKADALTIKDKDQDIKLQKTSVNDYVAKDGTEKRKLQGGIPFIGKLEVPPELKPKPEEAKPAVKPTDIPVPPTPTTDKREPDWEGKERRSIRTMCLAYAKDLVVGGHGAVEDMERQAEEMFAWVYEDVPEKAHLTTPVPDPEVAQEEDIPF